MKSEDAQPRWLDDEQQQAWLSLIGMMMRLPAALEAQLQRDAGGGSRPLRTAPCA